MISEERQNVDEVYSRNREVWELTERGPQRDLRTGEFGGTGGRGGGLGLESRGIVRGSRSRSICRKKRRDGRLLSGHREEKREEGGGVR